MTGDNGQPLGYGSRLHDQHAAKLAASGVSVEVAAERDYRTADTKAQLGRDGFSPAQRCPPALVIPLHGTNGDGVVSYQCRPDQPRIVNGKAVKYETAVGQSMVLDCPPRCRDRLGDPAVPLWVTEGPIKADAAAGIGLCCVALLGVWNWRNGNGWLPDWEHVALKGRQVFVVFDSDAVLKESVHAAMARLGAVLAAKGAEVLYVYLPSDAGAKIGLDDYLAAGHGVEDLLALASTELRRLEETAERSEPPKRQPASQRNLGEVDAVFSEWLLEPDLGALHAILAAVVANRAPGDPVWLLAVAPPSSGKTEMLIALAEQPDVLVTGKLTMPALLSGAAARERAGDATGGVLRVLGERGILVNKDFGSILAMHRDGRADVLQALREIYDGRWTRDVGVDGARRLEWVGHCGFVAGCVPAIDGHHSVVAALGDRYVTIRFNLPDDDKQGARAVTAAGVENEKRRAAVDAINGLLDHTSPDLPALPPTDIPQIAQLASLSVRCRSVVDRDPRTGEVVNVPAPEQPARLAKQLAKILAALRSIGEPDPWHVVTRCALDSMPAVRLTVLRHVVATGETVSTSAIAESVDLPSSTTRRTLEDLAAHRVITRAKQGAGKPDLWAPTDWTRGHWPQTFPEKSSYLVMGVCNTPEDTHTQGVYAPSDKSGKVCAPCASPDVYMVAYDGRPLCRPCVHKVAEEMEP